MGTQKEVVYPTVAAFSGAGAVFFGPYPSGTVNKLLRAEVHGAANYQGLAVGASSVFTNQLLWGLQWVAHGAGALDPVTSSDDDHWLIRQQTGDQSYATSWAPSTATAGVLSGVQLAGSWAGQLPIGASIDLFLALKSDTGLAVANLNVFATIRWWWS